MTFYYKQTVSSFVNIENIIEPSQNMIVSVA